MKKLLVCLVLILVATSFVFGCAKEAPAPAPTPAPAPAPAPAKAIELTLNTQCPAAAEPAVYEPTMYFINETEKRTEGRVKVIPFWQATLAPSPETFDATVKGICDIGESLVGFTRGRFPKTSAACLPFGYPSSLVMAHAITDFVDKYSADEFDEAINLYFSTPPYYHLGTTDKPVRTVEDMQGLIIRASSPEAGSLFEELGATPRFAPMPEVYELLSKGVINGQASAIEAWGGFKFTEVCHYLTGIGFVHPGNPVYTVVNKESWSKLAPQDQEAILELGKEMTDVRSKSWDKWNVTHLEEYRDTPGNEVFSLSPEDKAKMKAAAERVIEKWVAEQTAKGYPAAEWVAFLKERLAYWTQKYPEVMGEVE